MPKTHVDLGEAISPQPARQGSIVHRTDLDATTVRYVDLSRWIGQIVQVLATVDLRYVWVASASPDTAPTVAGTQDSAPATGAMNEAVMALLPATVGRAEMVDSDFPFLAVLTTGDASGELFVHPW